MNSNGGKESLRPSVKVHVQEPTNAGPPGCLLFNMELENVRPVPVHIEICEVKIPYDGPRKPYDLMNPLDSPIGKSIDPAGCKIIPLTAADKWFLEPGNTFKLHVWVRYRGLASKPYNINFYVDRVNGTWGEGSQSDTCC